MLMKFTSINRETLVDKGLPRISDLFNPQSIL